MSHETEIRPFRVDIPEDAIVDLKRRIAATRWPDQETVPDRSQGVRLTHRILIVDDDLHIPEAALGRPRHPSFARAGPNLIATLLLGHVQSSVRNGNEFRDWYRMA